MPPPAPTLFPYPTLFRSCAAPPRRAPARRRRPRRSRPRSRGRVETQQLRDAGPDPRGELVERQGRVEHEPPPGVGRRPVEERLDRKSTRLNSSHMSTSYAAPGTYTLSLPYALPILRSASTAGSCPTTSSQTVTTALPRASRDPAAPRRGPGPARRARRAAGSRRARATARGRPPPGRGTPRSEEHTSELQSHVNLVCRPRHLHSFPTLRSSDLAQRLHGGLLPDDVVPDGHDRAPAGESRPSSSATRARTRAASSSSGRVASSTSHRPGSAAARSRNA